MKNTTGNETETDIQWQRFEKAVDAAVNGGPKHRPAQNAAPKASSSTRGAAIAPKRKPKS